MKICLIRHGETDWNLLGKFQGREDIPLNITGVQQIQKAANALKKISWDELITSPLSRARMSAEIIRKEVELREIHEEKDFVERNLGAISGMTQEEADRHFPDGNYEGLESTEALQARAMDALTKWMRTFDGKNIVIVTHGAAINAILTSVSENKIEMGKAIPKNAGITLLEKQGDALTIVFYNKDESEWSRE